MGDHSLLNLTEVFLLLTIYSFPTWRVRLNFCSLGRLTILRARYTRLGVRLGESFLLSEALTYGTSSGYQRNRAFIQLQIPLPLLRLEYYF